MAAATTSSEKVSPQRPNGRLLVTMTDPCSLGNVADLVDDDEPVAADLLQLGLEPPGVVGFGQAGDPVRCGVELDRVPGPGGGDAEPDRQVRLADSRRPEQDHVLRLRDERAGGQVGQDVTPQRGQVIEVEILQRLDRREVGGADPHHGALGLAVGDLPLQQGGEVLLVRPVLRKVPDPSRQPQPTARRTWSM